MTKRRESEEFEVEEVLRRERQGSGKDRPLNKVPEEFPSYSEARLEQLRRLKEKALKNPVNINFLWRKSGRSDNN